MAWHILMQGHRRLWICCGAKPLTTFDWSGCLLITNNNVNYWLQGGSAAQRSSTFVPVTWSAHTMGLCGGNKCSVTNWALCGIFNFHLCWSGQQHIWHVDLDKSSRTFYSGAYFTILCLTETYHNFAGCQTKTLVFILWVSSLPHEKNGIFKQATETHAEQILMW